METTNHATNIKKVALHEPKLPSSNGPNPTNQPKTGKLFDFFIIDKPNQNIRTIFLAFVKEMGVSKFSDFYRKIFRADNFLIGFCPGWVI